MSILRDLPELLKSGVVTQETADRIQEYYRNRKSPSTNRLFVIFGILGAILVGLGIILIIAHNWDELSIATKTFFAFLPLLVGQGLCGYALIKQPNSVAWRESAASFLFFAVGASISLVSQIYNIPGDMGSFMLTWMLLSLPLVYLLKSSIASLLYIVGITYYATVVASVTYPSSEAYWYWPLLLGVLPHYYFLYQTKPESNFMIFHNWLVPLSVIISLGTVAENTEHLMFVAYFSLFGLLYVIGDSEFFNRQRSISNGYKILGSLGTIILLLSLSFDWFWRDLRGEDLQLAVMFTTPEFIAAEILSVLAAVALYRQYKGTALSDVKPLAVVFLLFIVTFILGTTSFIPMVLINLYVLVIGISTIRDGARRDHLGVLNYGLLIITALVICRFFDTHLSFVLRGAMFVSVGAGFFAANYMMLKKRKANG